MKGSSKYVSEGVREDVSFNDASVSKNNGLKPLPCTELRAALSSSSKTSESLKHTEYNKMSYLCFILFK